MERYDTHNEFGRGTVGGNPNQAGVINVYQGGPPGGPPRFGPWGQEVRGPALWDTAAEPHRREAAAVAERLHLRHVMRGGLHGEDLRVAAAKVPGEGPCKERGTDARQAAPLDCHAAQRTAARPVVRRGAHPVRPKGRGTRAGGRPR